MGKPQECFKYLFFFLLPFILGNTMGECAFFNALFSLAAPVTFNDVERFYPQENLFFFKTIAVEDSGFIFELNPFTGAINLFYVVPGNPDLNDIIYLYTRTEADTIIESNLIFGEGGTILRVAKDNPNWNLISSPVSENLNKAVIPGNQQDKRVIIAVGDRGTIIKSADYGLSWEVIPFPDNRMDLSDVSSQFDEDTLKIFVVGSFYTRGISTDGGETWEISGGPEVPGTAYNSFNRGNKTSAAIEGFNTIFTYDNNHVFIGGGRGIGEKTTDGGKTWSSFFVNGFEEINGLFFTSPDSGVAAGSPAAAKFTTDGGISWFEDISISHFLDGRNIKRIVSFGKNYGMIIGSGGLCTFIAPDSTYLDSLRIPTAVKSEIQSSTEFMLYQNYPNPFNPETHFEFRIPASPAGGSDLGLVNLSVFNILGKEMAILLNEEMPPGKYRINFNASGLPSGVYFYRLTAGKFKETKKFVLLK